MYRVHLCMYCHKEQSVFEHPGSKKVDQYCDNQECPGETFHGMKCPECGSRAKKVTYEAPSHSPVLHCGNEHTWKPIPPAFNR